MGYPIKYGVSKFDRLDRLKAFMKKKGLKFEHQGYLEGGSVVHGVMTTKRGGRYYVRASSMRDQRSNTVVVRSTKTTKFTHPNSISLLINNQVLKGKVIGRYTIPKKQKTSRRDPRLGSTAMRMPMPSIQAGLFGKKKR